MHQNSWIFPWRKRYRRRWSLLMACMIASGIVTLLIVSINVRVFPASVGIDRSANVMLLPNDAAWTAKVAQLTPFPLTPDQSILLRMREQVATANTQRINWNYQPKLLDVPLHEESNKLVTSPVFPPLPKEQDTPFTAAKPISFVLHKIGNDPSVQISLTPPQPQDLTLPALSQRYLILLDGMGKVKDVVTTQHKSDPTLEAIMKWIKTCQFSQSDGKEKWISVQLSAEVKND